MRSLASTIKKIFHFYYDGFREMTSLGRRIWLVILIKLFIIFIVLKIFFFPDLLRKNFRTDDERSNYVRNQILNTNK